MKLEILDIEKFVEVNRLPRVLDPIYLGRDYTPTEEGLFSYEIFGRPGSDDRRRLWAYIDLGQPFLHPLVYKTCTQLDRRFAEVLAGQRYVRANPRGGGLTEDEEQGWTGLGGLYEHWDEIRWGRPGDRGQRLERVRLVEVAKKKLAFVTKFPVLPAMSRDIDLGAATGGRIMEIPPINDLYRTLLTTAPPRDSGMSLVDGNRQRRAQETLLEIHESMLQAVGGGGGRQGKNALLQEKLLGKNTDYAVQAVISGPALGAARGPREQQVPFGHIGIPLYLVLNLFQPFVMKELEELMRPIRAGQQRLTVNRASPGEPARYEEIELPPAAIDAVGPETYRRWISRFMRDQKSRLDPVELELPAGERFRLPVLDYYLGRETTLTDLFFAACSLATANKHVLFTRYPIEHFQSTTFAKVSIITTEKTERRELGEDAFPTWPVLTGRVRWVDSVRINNAYTESLGADFDGLDE